MERLRNQIGSSEVVEVRNSRKLLHPCAGGKGNALEAHSLVLSGRNWIHGEDATVAEKLPRERERPCYSFFTFPLVKPSREQLITKPGNCSLQVQPL